MNELREPIFAILRHQHQKAPSKRDRFDSAVDESDKERCPNDHLVPERLKEAKEYLAQLAISD